MKVAWMMSVVYKILKKAGAPIDNDDKLALNPSGQTLRRWSPVPMQMSNGDDDLLHALVKDGDDVLLSPC